MSQISTRINLAALAGVSVRSFKSKGSTVADVECLVIPIEYNNLFVGEKGVYLDLQGFAIANKVNDSKDTHLVKQSIPKERYDVMTDEQKRAVPILGSHVLWADRSLGDSTPPVKAGEEDDLPF